MSYHFDLKWKGIKEAKENEVVLIRSKTGKSEFMAAGKKAKKKKARKSPLRSAAVSKEDVTFDTFRFRAETIF